MKTILDKVDPKYIECTAGLCEHVTHQYNTVLIVVTIVVLSAVSLSNCLKN